MDLETFTATPKSTKFKRTKHIIDANNRNTSIHGHNDPHLQCHLFSMHWERQQLKSEPRAYNHRVPSPITTANIHRYFAEESVRS
ncbi:hypothetical protein VTL71DRAFT_10771 [Oculimacula yallundae]|uniref:Ycf15 n=1 Tax=Oculimacula yallundae TaxID=86028 RepID=A0ABR4CUE6_9HELO